MWTFAIVFTYQKVLGFNNISIIIGTQILYLIYKDKYLKNKISEENIISYQDFLKKIEYKNDNRKRLKLGSSFIIILSTFPNDLFTIDYNIDYSIYESNLTIINLNSDHLDSIKDNIIISPLSLPMICEPNKWTDNSFGGYLENTQIKRNLITGSNYHNHKIENK